MNLADTIVAVSSPAGAGERAIVRLSGPRAVAIADGVFMARDSILSPTGSLIQALTYTVHAGALSLPGSSMSVPAIVYLMRGPRSYTREDVVEFHVGAWPAVVPLVVAGLIEAGARPAEPGEFTFRAFVSGRVDLAQAEAVAAVVSASSEATLRAAGDLLAGHLSREVAGLVGRLRQVLALVEADLDFSDQDIEPAPPREIAERISTIRRDLAALGRRARRLETFGGEVRLVLAGRPNVGKSSLFNRLLEADRAIVAPVPGTTRDELRAALHAGGLVFTLSDVAGLSGAPSELPGGTPPGMEPAADEVAGQARAKALEAIGRADLVILALDASAPYDAGAEELVALVASPMVAAITKCDLAPPDRARAWLAAGGIGVEVIPTSAVTGEGIEALRAALVRAVAGGAVDREAVGPVVTARHRAALEQAAAALARAGRVARRGGTAGELVAVELREALETLGTITGQAGDGDVLGEIFARFCVGK
ncbi:MAG: 50S ribosome-binding GTPase [Planctomycetota bacterium]|nr:50S ribosome-binding GTPase [Planctomycetota bacterium]